MVFPVAALVFGALPAMGCTVPSSSDNPDAEAIAQSTTAVVVVERTTGPGEAAHADNVVARFVRVQQGIVDDQVLRVVGAADDVPAPVPAMGTCTAVDPDHTESFEGRSSAARTPRGTTLLDVGAVALEDSKTSGAKGTELLPRMMPDPAGVVSGVIYSARANDAFTAGGRVTLRVSGGADLEAGFVAQFNAPRDVSDVHVRPSKTGVDVTWDATDVDARDVVYVELLTPSSVVVTRCAVSDSTGHVFVPFASSPLLDEGQVAVHRLHREPFRVVAGKSAPEGEIRFNTVRIVTYPTPSLAGANGATTR